jgi:transposase
VADVVAQLGPGTRLVYEAGPTGFGLARAGAELGVDVVVCAAGSVPRPAGDRVKTDRRDAERLLRLWRAGELSLVRVRRRPRSPSATWCVLARTLAAI